MTGQDGFPCLGWRMKTPGHKKKARWLKWCFRWASFILFGGFFCPFFFSSLLFSFSFLLLYLLHGLVPGSLAFYYVGPGLCLYLGSAIAARIYFIP